MSEYSIWALEFSQLPEYPGSQLVHGLSDAPLATTYVYSVVRSGDHIALIDSGWNRNEFCSDVTRELGFVKFQDPVEILGRIGLTPEDIDTIVISHHHWDHVSGISYFPNAQVYIQGRDVESWHEKMAASERLSWLRGPLDPETGADLQAVQDAGRLHLVNGKEQILPGIEVRPAYDTHTAGSQYVLVDAIDGGDPWVFCGDVAYMYDNIGGLDGSERMVPIATASGSLELCVRATDEMLTAAGNNSLRVIPSHDPRLFDRYPTKTWDDGLHLAELQLAPGVKSLL